MNKSNNLKTHPKLLNDRLHRRLEIVQNLPSSKIMLFGLKNEIV